LAQSGMRRSLLALSLASLAPRLPLLCPLARRLPLLLASNPLPPCVHALRCPCSALTRAMVGIYVYTYIMCVCIYVCMHVCTCSSCLIHPSRPHEANTFYFCVLIFFLHHTRANPRVPPCNYLENLFLFFILVCVCVCVCVCVHIRMYIHTYIHTYTHTHTHAHTHAHTHTHTHTRRVTKRACIAVGLALALALGRCRGAGCSGTTRTLGPSRTSRSGKTCPRTTPRTLEI